MDEIEETGVPDESERAGFGLTTKELKARLKHIAGLCYALACEISNAEIEADYLRGENTYLRRRLKQAGINVGAPPKSIVGLLRRRERYAKELSAAMGKPEAEQTGAEDDDG